MSNDSKYPKNRCPLCGQENDCGMATGQGTCWCYGADVSPEVLKQLPEEARGVACLCRACAEGRRLLPTA